MENVYYIKSLEIENVKCFSKKTKINFYKSKDSKKLSRWNLLLGDNGSGKTTLLKCIYLSLADDFYLGKAEDFHKYGRDKTKPSIINTEICKSLNVLDIVEEKEKNNYRRSGFLEEFNIKINGPSIRKSRKSAPVFAYGATRILSNNSKRDRSSRREFGNNLFDENSSLISAEEWILEVDYLDKLKNDTLRLSKVNNIILKLFKGIISEIRINNENNTRNIPTAEFKTKYGWVKLNELSLGYKTIISWVIDFTYKLSDYYYDTRDIFSEPAIVIVDEIDLHLHVSFQKKLVKFLTNTFKKVQFIVSAHSPLIVQASSDANILLLKRTGSSAKIQQNEADISKWRIDQLYNSELFGNLGARPESISKLINKKSNLLLKTELTESEMKEIEMIDSELNDIPSGQTKFEMEAIELLKKAATICKDDINK